MRMEGLDQRARVHTSSLCGGSCIFPDNACDTLSVDDRSDRCRRKSSSKRDSLFAGFPWLFRLYIGVGLCDCGVFLASVSFA